LETGEEVVYPLPRIENPRLSTGGDRDATPIAPFLTPGFTSAVVDEHGNLWFSYFAGHTYVGVAYR
ncbi:MAG: hypothetical protein U1E08_04180, partial [Coriobacteriia bacterium]|nr:hypothetical protein [Coriobacteriia bacterium]